MFSNGFAGTFGYSALESLKNKEYSKMSDLFSVGATLFEWDTKKPFLYSRVECQEKVEFYLEVHEKGRLVENEDEKGNVTYLKNLIQEGFRRESLVPERAKKSRFASVLDQICHKDPKSRTSAEAVLQSKELKYCLELIRKLAENGN
jgi:serine/threonine protein kinase